MRPLPSLVACALLLVPACVRYSRTATVPRIQPPPGTGQVQTDFVGNWLVIEVRSPTGGLTAGEGGGFTLPGVGSVIALDDRGFVSSDRQELRREHMTLPVNTRVTDYLNQGNGRTAFYSLKIEPEPARGGEQFDQVQMAFGTEDQQHLLGLVFFHLAPVAGTPARQGTFLVRLQKGP